MEKNTSKIRCGCGHKRHHDGASQGQMAAPSQHLSQEKEVMENRRLGLVFIQEGSRTSICKQWRYIDKCFVSELEVAGEWWTSVDLRMTSIANILSSLMPFVCTWGCPTNLLVSRHAHYDPAGSCSQRSCMCLPWAHLSSALAPFMASDSGRINPPFSNISSNLAPVHRAHNSWMNLSLALSIVSSSEVCS